MENWNGTVWSAIQGLFSAFFNVELPEWTAIADEIKKQWAETIWPAIQAFFLVSFDIALPDWTAIQTDIETFKTNVIDLLVAKWGEVQTAVGNAFQSVVDWLNKNVSEPLATFKANVIDPIAANWNEIVAPAIAAAATAVGDFMGIDLAEGWNKVTSAVSEAWDSVVGKINSAINAVKNFFGFGGSAGNAEITITAREEGPKFAKGGVFTKPTFFDTRLGRTEVGEGGEPEAVAPISVLQGYVAEAVASQNAQLVGALDAIYGVLVALDANMGSHMREALDGTSFSVNKREFARLVKAVE